MTTLTATPRPGEYLMYEADHEKSHDQITVALSQTLVAGQVIGKITVGVATAVYVANAGNTGTAEVFGSGGRKARTCSTVPSGISRKSAGAP